LWRRESESQSTASADGALGQHHGDLLNKEGAEDRGAHQSKADKPVGHKAKRSLE
jgi:hypothetical protein